MIGRWFKSRKDRQEKARKLYFAAAQQARQPAFYQEMGVPDTLDGRFEMTTLHIFMIMKTLKEGEDKAAKALSQALFDRMFKVTDQAIREMGIGDLGVPRHMKRMMTAFNGRAYSYTLALDGGQDLRAALARNIFGTMQAPPDAGVLTRLETYVRESMAALDKNSALRGEAHFAPLTEEGSLRRHG